RGSDEVVVIRPRRLGGLAAAGAGGFGVAGDVGQRAVDVELFERRVLARDVFLDGRELDVWQGAVDVGLFVRFADFQRGCGESEAAECNCGDEAFHGVLPRLVDRYCIRHYFRRRRPRGRVTQGSAYSNRNQRVSTPETMHLIGAAYL